VCCRADSIPRDSNNNTAAAFWGSSSKCEVPIWLIENMFQNIANNEEVRISSINNHLSFLTFLILKFDIIFWTGDISAHNIWNILSKLIYFQGYVKNNFLTKFSILHLEAMIRLLLICKKTILILFKNLVDNF
jgi:hypothetical protein